jgi:hypothetical protein
MKTMMSRQYSTTCGNKPMKHLIIFCIVFLNCCISISQESQSKLPIEFKGTVVDVGGAIPGGGVPSFKMKIEKYTSDKEVLRFAKLLEEKGQDALASELHDIKNGSFSIGSSFPYHVSITRFFEQDGKRVFRALTDRPITMFEKFGSLRDMDHPFGFIEIIVDSNGNGAGQIVVATEIEIKDGSLEMRYSGLEPFRIIKVTAK